MAVAKCFRRYVIRLNLGEERKEQAAATPGHVIDASCSDMISAAGSDLSEGLANSLIRGSSFISLVYSCIPCVSPPPSPPPTVKLLHRSVCIH